MNKSIDFHSNKLTNSPDLRRRDLMNSTYNINKKFSNESIDKEPKQFNKSTYNNSPTKSLLNQTTINM